MRSTSIKDHVEVKASRATASRASHREGCGRSMRSTSGGSAAQAKLEISISRKFVASGQPDSKSKTQGTERQRIEGPSVENKIREAPSSSIWLVVFSFPLIEHLARGYRAFGSWLSGIGPWLSGIWPVVIEPLARGYRNPRCEHLARAYPYCDCPTDHQIADFFTKPLDAAKFTGFREHLLS